MWAMSRVPKPVRQRTPNRVLRKLSLNTPMANTNKSIMDTPVMMSALVKGMLFTAKKAVRERRRME